VTHWEVDEFQAALERDLTPAPPTPPAVPKPVEPVVKEAPKVPPSSPVGIPGTGLIGHWTFDEAKGAQAGDSSSCRNPGALANGASWTDGKLGSALHLNGGAACVRVQPAPSLSDLGPVTMMAWIRPAALALGRVIAKEDSGRGRWMLIAGETAIGFAKDFAGQELRRNTVPHLLAVNAWSHLAVTWDGSAQATQVHVYVNGLEAAYAQSQDGKGEKMSDAALPLFIGNRGDLTRGFVGAIDDVRIYRRILPPAEIAAQASSRPK